MNRSDVTQLVKTMIAAPSCCQELKDAGQYWLDAGPDAKPAAAAKLEQEIREDIATIDEAISFYRSPLALEIFGAELRQQKIEHAEKRKAAGEKWCDCPACAAGLAILEHADLLR